MLVACQIHKVIAGYSLHCPIGHWLGTDAAIEAKGWLVPAKDPPLQAPIAIGYAFTCQLGEQRFSVPVASVGGPHIKVFQINAVLAEPS